eukprot:CAMPEP_0170624676 /NCGR_PEP_ID=MMETSP0224-20130122/30354_1 /TAXON_ID=285029 /ORGANISM="Togula jolla, Strain CCCM 725" /LENGTH=456 /DNA_ID=CAMNT_0010951203 /DNA_START=99 /DNA_END=1469 /DNA_ORIENTATION=+
MEAAVDFLSPYGDLARVDLSSEAGSGSILVTFFDVRSAQHLLDKFPEIAAPAPPGAEDFIAVAIPSSVFVSLRACNVFERFGDVSNIAMSDGDVLVTFNDMRAAQKAVQSVEGCVARPMQEQNEASPAALSSGPLQHQAAPAAGTDGAQPMQRGQESSVEVQSHVSHPGHQGNEGQQSLQILGKKQSKKDGSQIQQCNSRKLLKQDLEAKKKSSKNQHVAAPTSKPVETAVHMVERTQTKELSKYDILPEQIRDGQDVRTAVMVRNIPKALSRESFTGLLSCCGLQDRYTFLYMPFGKRRTVHSGFAFVNFMSPQDVLSLHDSMQTQLWRSLPGSSGWNKPAVSYARIQGHEKLMKRFRLSAVMFDQDVLRRPIFRHANGSDESYDVESEGVCCSSSSQSASLSGSAEGQAKTYEVPLPPSLQPLYVQLWSPMAPFTKQVDPSTFRVDISSTAYGA